MVKVLKYDNEFGHQVKLDFNGDKSLEIMYGGNLDLYFIPNFYKSKKDHIFEINKLDDPDLYNIFNNLFRKVTEYKAIDNKVDNTFKKQDKLRTHPLVKDEMITWISDDDPEDIASQVTIFKQGDKICLFFQEGKHQNGFKTNAIRISTDGSRYGHFFIPFMELYSDILKQDFDYHQITIDEYLLSLKHK